LASAPRYLRDGHDAGSSRAFFPRQQVKGSESSVSDRPEMPLEEKWKGCTPLTLWNSRSGGG